MAISSGHGAPGGEQQTMEPMEKVYWEPDASGEKIADAERVAEYLAAAQPVLAAARADVDALDPNGKVIGSAAWVTDGEFVFSASLSYYLRTYHLSPPARLLERVRELNYACPNIEPERTHEASELLGVPSSPPANANGFSPF